MWCLLAYALSGVGAHEIERRAGGALRSACLEIFSAFEIERRPRGASRASPLLHLLQRAMA